MEERMSLEERAVQALTARGCEITTAESCTGGMLASMLEGDTFVTEPKVRSRIAGTLTIRDYVDNLSPERRTWAAVNQA